MLAYPAALLNLDLIILDPLPNAPSKQVLNHSEHLSGSFTDAQAIAELASKVDILTVEIEHINTDALEAARSSSGGRSVDVQPAPSTLRTIQDKFLQKQWLEAKSIPVAPFQSVDGTESAILAAGKQLGYPFMLKTRKLAYDGRGNFVVRSQEDAQEALKALGCGNGEKETLYAEKWVPFTKEVAVMVVRGKNGEVRSYPPVETIHRNSICHLVFAPLRATDQGVLQRAKEMAEKAVATFEGAGVFGVEMFLTSDGSLSINEIAPRPHNSGHYTIEACECSQYENHLRAILGLPLGSTKLKVPSAVMVNLLGPPAVDEVANNALHIPGATVHLYGKAESRPGRKMGHVTIVGSSDAEVRARVRPLLLQLGHPQDPSYGEISKAKGGDFGSGSGPKKSSKYPLVGIIMGSDSDLPVMRDAATILDGFGIEYELTIVSAHRTPERLVNYANSAASRGLRVIIAGAGGAAHLPGMVASMTSLPVIGVPVRGSSLDGVDSLYSIVQMPRGIPVATVAINNSTNAGLLAARIIGTSIPPLLERVSAYSKRLENEVMGKVSKLEEVGWEAYVVKK
ncbi:hypothetical protein M408DRAFT_71414 [Serendipita vermifera MAFF 305830]|uniref:Phosphoribosylaminoimidazole carboxylase n=1 Tax=Serendipita vermifera MAFF 305830 TaxID=933852 RepID=A0A0C3B561_SERVB|nr:hypothetical protein M408DRAFT_71414 [Serendipita vermifera MAFF 305830]